MNLTSTIAFDPFHRNLDALREFQSELAEQLAAAPEPSQSNTLESTRDGRVNFRARSNGAWFGRTSIPLVRAEALLQQFQSGTANVLLPGIAAGTEVALLTQRLGRHRAIYVWEPDIAAIKMTLSLHDYSPAIRDERLIFLVCAFEQLGQTLFEWLEQHPGHLPPDRILMWPWQSLAELAPCRAVLESTYQTVEQRRAKQLDAIRNAPHPNPPPLNGGGKNVAILGLYARDDVWAVADALAAGGSALGWRLVVCDVRTPADVHPLARASKLVQTGLPDWAVLLGVTRQDLKGILPESVPAVSWFSTPATLDAGLSQAVGKNDYVAVTSPWLLDRAHATGIDRKRISICPPPCLAGWGGTDPPRARFAVANKSVIVGAGLQNARTKTDLCVPPRRLPPSTFNDRSLDLAIMADLGPTDAESFGHRLPSHGQVWNTAVDLLKARIESFADTHAEEILARAEEKARVRFDDAALRRNTLDALVLGAGQTLLWRFLVEALLAEKIRVCVIGTGWATVPGVEVLDRPRTWQTRSQLATQSKLLLEADTTGSRTAEVLLAAGMGAVVLWRQTPRDNQPGGLATLLKPAGEFVSFSSARELVQRVQTLLSAESARKTLADRAIARCQSEHSPAARLTTLKSLIGPHLAQAQTQS